MSGGNPFKRFAFGAAPPVTEERPEARAPASAPQPKRVKRGELDSSRQPPRVLHIKTERGSDADRSPPVKNEHNDAVKLVKRDDDNVKHFPDVPVKLEYEDDEAKPAEQDSRLELLLRLFKAREEMMTPIDAFGTQACVAPHAKVERNRRFHILVAALLSSQTNDKITHAAMQRLHTQLGDGDTESDSEGLTVEKVRVTNEDSLDALINPVGFHRKKAQQVKQVAEMLNAEYSSDIPRSYDELVRLPGIGPKIARVILLLAWNQVDGLIVDTHVHRLAHRLGWTLNGIPGVLLKSGPEDIKTAEDTRKALEGWIPQEYWAKFSRAVVGFGQAICVAVNPKCASCPLADLCPSAFRVASSKKSILTSANA